MDIPIIGGAYRGRSRAVDAQECQNLFPVIDQEGGKIISLANTPGLKSWVDIGEAREVRGSIEMADNLYAVVGNKVWKITSAGVASQMAGLITGVWTGRVKMVENGSQVCIVVPGDAGYYCDGTTVTKITAAGFPTPGALAYQDGLGIVSEYDTDYWQYSGSYDFSTWDAGDRARTEGQPDKIVDIISDHREVWLIGSKYSEVWYNSAETFTFSRIAAAVLELGGIGNTLVKLDNSVMWLDNFGMVRRAEGYTPVIISTDQIAYLISQTADMSNYYAYGYQQEGHSFYVLCDPAGLTFAYDASTKFWHTRASGARDTRDRINCYTHFGTKHIVGDFQNGQLYELDLDTFDDNGTRKRAIRVSQPISQDRKYIYWDRLELNIEAGVGINTGQGSDPKVIMQYSDDHGKTWSSERWASMGKMGDYKDKVVWRQLGRSKERIFKFIVADPVKRIITGASANVRLGRH